MEPIFSPEAAAPRGPYVQAIKHDSTVYVSGILGITPQGQPVTGSPEDEFAQILSNLGAILAAAGCGPESLLKVTLYLADIEFIPVVNALYAEFMGEHRCARSMVPIQSLPAGFRMELDAVAVCDN